MPRWLGEVPDGTVVTTVRRVQEVADPAVLLSTDPGNGVRLGSDGKLFYDGTVLTLTVDPAEVRGYAREGDSFQETMHVDASHPGTPVTLVSSDPAVTLSPSQGATPLTVLVEVNASDLSLEEPRTAQVTTSALGAADVVTAVTAYSVPVEPSCMPDPQPACSECSPGIQMSAFGGFINPYESGGHPAVTFESDGPGHIRAVFAEGDLRANSAWAIALFGDCLYDHPDPYVSGISPTRLCRGATGTVTGTFSGTGLILPSATLSIVWLPYQPLDDWLDDDSLLFDGQNYLAMATNTSQQSMDVCGVVDDLVASGPGEPNTVTPGFWAALAMVQHRGIGRITIDPGGLVLEGTYSSVVRTDGPVTLDSDSAKQRLLTSQATFRLAMGATLSEAQIAALAAEHGVSADVVRATAAAGPLPGLKEFIADRAGLIHG